MNVKFTISDSDSEREQFDGDKSGEPEYFINMHLGGKLVRDPVLRYDGGVTVRIKEDPVTICYFDLENIVRKGLVFNNLTSVHYYVPESESVADDVVNKCVNAQEINKGTEKDVGIIETIENDLRCWEIETRLESESVNVKFNDTHVVAEEDEVNVEDLGSQDDVNDGPTVVEEDEVNVEDLGSQDDVNDGPAVAEEDEAQSDEENVFLMRVRYNDEGERDEEIRAARENNRKFKLRGKNDAESGEEKLDDIDPLIQYNEARDRQNVADQEAEGYGYQGSDLEEDRGALRNDFPTYNHNSSILVFSLGMMFRNNAQFKNAIRKYSVCTRRELKIVKNEPKRIRVKCIASAECPWTIFASFSKQARGLQVKSYQDEHNSAVSFKNKMCNVRLISDHFEQTIKDNPRMTLNEIKSKVKGELKAEVNLTRCKRAKALVYEKLTGNYKEEFARLRDYADELLEKNPGSTVIIATDRVTPESPIHFKRMYMCFDALKRGFRKGCRPIIGVDGCFLKGPTQGELLTAVGRDGNNQMYPIAWAVVEVECKDSWTWFLEILQSDLGLGDGKGFSIISDKQKGLEQAVMDILPRVEHRNCARHVFANWEGHKRPKELEFAFWDIVKSTTEREFEENFKVLEKLDATAAESLRSKNPKQWCKAFFGTHSKTDAVENNLCEAFNSSILLARHKSIISMLEDIRVRVMERIEEKRIFCSKWKNSYGPLIKEKFDDSKKEGVDWQVRWNGEKGCEVKKGNKQYTVDLPKKLCSCRSWQLTGIPCPHACCAIWNDGKNPDDFIHKWYNPQTFMRAFQHALQPINGAHEWKIFSLDPIMPPQPRKMPGRPRKNRRRAKGEPRKKPHQLSRVGTINTCSICGAEGHNKLGCQRRGEANREVRPRMQRSQSKGDSSVPTDKGKRKMQESHNRPIKMKKQTIKGYGLYTNLKNGEQTFYSGGSKGIRITEPIPCTSVRGIKRTAIDGPARNKEPIQKKKK
ncbi:hypothetical protein PTKIN_Ptkin07bG0263300 [Pterospermum kingtungense]